MAYAKIKTIMSDERFKKIISGAAPTPNTPSIMSAPRNDKKSQRNTIIIIGNQLNGFLTSNAKIFHEFCNSLFFCHFFWFPFS